MDTAQWPQGIEVINNKAMESGARPPIPPLPSSTTNTNNMVERRIGGGGTQVRPQKEQALNCPRCNSSNTKFCYYNNYSLSQPRYFCKTCRRYWTEGGSLRNVPVGGGSRKNKRPTPPSSSSSIPTPTPSKKLPDPHAFSDHHHHQLHIQNPSHKMMNNFHAGQDLNLGFPPLSGENYNANMPHTYNNTSTNPSSSSSLSAMELLKNSAGLGPIYSSGYGNLQEYKPPSGAQALNFTLDGFDQSGGGGGYGVQVHQESNTTSASCRLLFPFEDLKQQVSSTGHDQGGGGHHGDASTAGYWNGMLGGGSW